MTMWPYLQTIWRMNSLPPDRLVLLRGRISLGSSGVAAGEKDTGEGDSSVADGVREERLGALGRGPPDKPPSVTAGR